MSETCDECGAAVPEGGTCRDNLNALLLLEWQISRGPGDLAHFYAVAAYNLQHPRSMDFTVRAVSGLRAALLDSLEGRATLDEIRLRARRGASAAGRVTRRPGDPDVRWPAPDWPMTIADVLGVEPELTAYSERVTRWARSVLAVLEA
jgi:hypothetical protein